LKAVRPEKEKENEREYYLRAVEMSWEMPWFCFSSHEIVQELPFLFPAHA
jgi:hypothetical protein